MASPTQDLLEKMELTGKSPSAEPTHFEAGNQITPGPSKSEKIRSDEERHIDEINQILGIEPHQNPLINPHQNLADGSTIASPKPHSPAQDHAVHKATDVGSAMPTLLAGLTAEDMSEPDKFAATEKCLLSIHCEMGDLVTLALLMEMKSVEAILYLYRASEVELEMGLFDEIKTIEDVDRSGKLTPNPQFSEDVQALLAHLRSVLFVGKFAAGLYQILHARRADITWKRHFFYHKERAIEDSKKLELQPLKLRLLEKMLRQAASGTVADLQPYTRRIMQEMKSFDESVEGAVSFFMHSEGGQEVPPGQWSSAHIGEYRLQFDKIGAQLNMLRNAFAKLEDIGQVEGDRFGSCPAFKG